MSVPYTTVSTYTARPSLSEELAQKLRKPYQGHAFAHAVAVTGLGGTGKTRLVLHHLQEHGKEYHTILWIDGRSEETARSSYGRCCRALGLPCNAGTDQGRLQDALPVQAVLEWLRGQEARQKWLVIVDNADDLSSDVGSTMPHGQAGSVIVISQDRQASRLLGGRSETVKVDVMETDEAVSLLSAVIGMDSSEKMSGIVTLLRQVVSLLDRLPLAIELAGARMKAEVDDGAETAVAMRRYVADFQRHQDILLRSNEFVHTSVNRKTVWTAWETSLTALRNLERSETDISPVSLLTFLSQFDRANIQDELFRLASLESEATTRELDIALPLWLEKVLSVGADGGWNMFYYRENVKALQRYGLVRAVKSTWDGVTMHSLVAWRARQEGNVVEHWKWYVNFLTAACSQMLNETERVQFRRHMIVHLPDSSRLVETDVSDREEGNRLVWTRIGRIWHDEGRWKESEQLFRTAVQSCSEALGEKHLDTLSGMADLASTYWKQGRWSEAEELDVRVMEIRKESLGEKHPDTLSSMANLAATYLNQGRWSEAEELEVWVIEIRKESLGEKHPDTLSSMANLAATYWNQGRWSEAEELQVRVMEIRKEALGEKHLDTLFSMANLAATYWKQRRWSEAEELEVRVMEMRKESLGEKHPDTLEAIENLAMTYRSQGRYDEARDIEANSE